jgi:competence protein ComEC
LHPAPNSRARRNAQSCVLAIRARSGRALLTGDIEQTVERELVRTAAPLAADVLVVPHHGSASSSSGDFVRAVAPRFALVSSGYRNRYGLPHATVVARYRASGAAVHDTALGGALVLDMRARGVVLTRARDRGFGFWRGARE